MATGDVVRRGEHGDAETVVRRDERDGRDEAETVVRRDDIVRRGDAGIVARRDDVLPPGVAIMPHGRVSVASEVRGDTKGPFTPVQLARLDEALTLASRGSRLPFSLYLGDLGPNTRARAEELHAGTADPARAVLIAVSPGQRLVEVVTGEESVRRLPNHACRLAVMAMVASFKEGDLAGGLVSGLRMLADQAGGRAS